jgi:hypothetical protein
MPNLNTNERWWFDKIREMIKNTRFGKIEVSLTINNCNVSTVKEKTEKSHSFNNDKL